MGSYHLGALSQWHSEIKTDTELRLCFPTVVANASPLSVLPQFVEVLGRKLDKISMELDRLVCLVTLVSMLNQKTNRFVAVISHLYFWVMQERLKMVGTSASNSYLIFD